MKLMVIASLLLGSCAGRQGGKSSSSVRTPIARAQAAADRVAILRLASGYFAPLVIADPASADGCIAAHSCASALDELKARAPN